MHQQSGKLSRQVALHEFAKVKFVVLLADWRPRSGLPRFLPSVSPGLCVCAGLRMRMKDSRASSWGRS